MHKFILTFRWHSEEKNFVVAEFPNCSETEDMSKVDEIFNGFK